MFRPSFLVLGAQKAGTTSLHDWLVQQPDVCLPTHKETHYFAEQYDNGWPWYQTKFPTCAPSSLVGEVDPEYLYHPEAPVRIRASIGTPRLVVVLREPLARAYSQYRMSVARGFETLSFGEALECEAERLQGTEAAFGHTHFSYLARGRYTEQLDRYLKVFDRNVLYLVRFEDLVSIELGADTYAKICRHIGVTSDPSLADRSQHRNAAVESRIRVLQNVLYGHGWVRRLGGRLLPTQSMRIKLMQRLRAMNEREAPKSERQVWHHEVPGWAWEVAHSEAEMLATRFGIETGWADLYESLLAKR